MSTYLNPWLILLSMLSLIFLRIFFYTMQFYKLLTQFKDINCNYDYEVFDIIILFHNKLSICFI